MNKEIDLSPDMAHDLPKEEAIEVLDLYKNIA